MISRGDADVMICGGSEAAITPMGVGGFAAMRALSTRNEEPQRAPVRSIRTAMDSSSAKEPAFSFSKNMDLAKKRGAPIIAELVGYGMSGDAFHITLPPDDGKGAHRVMLNAINDAGIKPEQVDYINAHGTSTPPNDRIETMAIKRLFGEHAKKLAISSTKSMIGHLLGAAGAVEAGITSLVVERGIIPPTINYDTPDPECDLDYAPNRARRPSQIRALEFVRIRRHQRLALIQEVRRLSQRSAPKAQMGWSLTQVSVRATTPARIEAAPYGFGRILCKTPPSLSLSG